MNIFQYNTNPTIKNLILGGIFKAFLWSLLWSIVWSFVYYRFLSIFVDIFIGFRITDSLGTLVEWFGIGFIFYIFFLKDAIHLYKANKVEKMHDSNRISRLHSLDDERFNSVLTDVSNEMVQSAGVEELVADLFKDDTIDVISPKLIQVTNEHRFHLAEKTVEELKEYEPYRLNQRYTKLIEALKEKKGTTYSRDNVVLHNAPFLNTLALANLTTERIHSLRKEMFVYGNLYKEAKEYAEKEVAIMGAGIQGERRTSEELDMHEGIWKHYANVRFEVNGKSVESDNIIVSTKGVFTIEVKNYSPYGHYDIHIKNDGQWLKIYSDGEVEPMADVTSQMNRHIALKNKKIRECYQEMYKDNIPLTLLPIIVIGNDNVQVQNDTTLPIMRVSQIYHHIINKPDVLTLQEVERISAIIEENMLSPKTYEMKDYLSAVKESFSLMVERTKHFDQLIELTEAYQTNGKRALLDNERSFR